MNSIKKMLITTIMPATQHPRTIYLCILCAALVLSGCKNQLSEEPVRKQLLIYCGITMIHPMREIADRIEKQENCTIKIIKGGSGTLYRSIEVNKQGDLFLPGSESYMKKCVTGKLVSETVRVGFNRAALVVPEGNPLHISADLKNLTKGVYRTVLGAPDSGSIGKETKRILDRAGLYDKAVERALYLTEDSKGLKQAIEEHKADLIINWYATALWPENRDIMDALLLDNSIAPAHNLILGLLEFSNHPEIARHFMELAVSAEGQTIFTNYGFGQ